MTLLAWDGLVQVDRAARVIAARFQTPHRVVSTASDGGGLREDATAVYNHQSCEPAGNDHGAHSYISAHLEELHRELCLDAGLDPDHTVGHGTAANMACAGVAERSFDELKVAAVCTAGVEGNAGRAGDPASIVEWEGGYHQVSAIRPPEHGTIVTMLFFNHELTPGALTRALMTATEAKTAVLQDLVVGSRYSEGRATGTGTDQFMGACPLGRGIPLRSAGKHVVLGQMIAEATSEAIRAALVLQNGLEPSAQRSVSAQLSRFGVTEEVLLGAARQYLPTREADLFRDNLAGIERDPHVVAASAALAEVADQVRAGVLPLTCTADFASWGGAMVAVAASGGIADPTEMRTRLAGRLLDLRELVPESLALGFLEKWKSLHAKMDADTSPGAPSGE